MATATQQQNGLGRLLRRRVARGRAVRGATKAYKKELRHEAAAAEARERRREKEAELKARIERDRIRIAERKREREERAAEKKRQTAERKEREREAKREREAARKEQERRERERRKELLAEQAARRREQKIAEREREAILKEQSGSRKGRPHRVGRDYLYVSDREITEGHRALSRGNPSPLFCADCEKPLGRGAVRMPDGRIVCPSCQKAAKRKAQDKSQRALFGGMDQDLFDLMAANPGEIDVTPEIALAWLRRNVGNRPLDRSKVRSMAELMRKGIYKRRKPLVFTNGILTDGQHTLNAIVRSGATVPLAVRRDELANPACGADSYEVKSYEVESHCRRRPGKSAGRQGDKSPRRPAKKPAAKGAAKKPAARAPRSKAAKARKVLTLSQFVRRLGGIRPDRDGDNAGELRRLSRKEAGTSGLVNRRGGESAEWVLKSAREAGYPVETLDDLYSELEADARGYYRVLPREAFEYTEGPQETEEQYTARKAEERYMRSLGLANGRAGERANSAAAIIGPVVAGFASGLGNAASFTLIERMREKKSKGASRANPDLVQMFINDLPTAAMRDYAKAWAAHRERGRPRPLPASYGLDPLAAQLVREGVDFALKGVLLARGDGGHRRANCSPRRRANGAEAARERERLRKLAEMFQGDASGAKRTLPISRHDDGKQLDRAGNLRFFRLKNRPAECDREARRLDHFSPARVNYHLCKRCGVRFNPAHSMLAFDTRGKLYPVGAGVRFEPPQELANPDGFVDYGPLDLVGYYTTKKHIGGGRPYTYVHPFAELTGKVEDMPRLLIDGDGMPRLKGGAYKLGPEGIIN